MSVTTTPENARSTPDNGHYTGHRANGRGTYIIDRCFGNFGRVKVASGTNDLETLREINETLTRLYTTGRFATILAIRERRLKPIEILHRDFPRKVYPSSRIVRPANLYAMRSVASGNIKIGIAADVGRRLISMRSHTWDEIELVCSVPSSRSEERDAHLLLAASRIRGEWYKPSPEVLAWVAVLGARP